MGTAPESADRTAPDSPPMASCNKRWSSALEYRGKESFPSYSEILIRSSQRLRERSMSPPPPPDCRVGPSLRNVRARSSPRNIRHLVLVQSLCLIYMYITGTRADRDEEILWKYIV